MACLGACGCAAANWEQQQLRATREKIWASYGGKDGGDCALTGASLPSQSTYILTAPVHPKAPYGSLPKSVIQDVIADHIGEIRACYEHSLGGWPDLAGRVAVKFIIQPDGSVHPAAVASTTLRHKPTECCITNTMRIWQFPPPNGGGIVVVTYPFVLEQVGGAK